MISLSLNPAKPVQGHESTQTRTRTDRPTDRATGSRAIGGRPAGASLRRISFRSWTAVLLRLAFGHCAGSGLRQDSSAGEGCGDLSAKMSLTESFQGLSLMGRPLMLNTFTT